MFCYAKIQFPFQKYNFLKKIKKIIKKDNCHRN